MKTKKIHELDSNMAITPIGDKPYQWFDPMDTSAMRLTGFCWIEKDRVYRRLPVCDSGVLPLAVNHLANCCAGGQVCFQTDSTRIAIDAEFANSHTMYHMPPTGQLGFDCYVGDCGKMQFAATVKFEAKKQKYCLPLFENIEKKMRTLTINLPLYNDTLKSLKIGLEPDCQLIPSPAYTIDKRIVIYGSSITQGGCASRPGMCYTNIISREIDAEFVNLGFSGSGKGEPEVMKTIASTPNMGLFVMDYEANINDDIYTNLEPSIDIIRSKHPQLQIAILSRIGYGQENIRPENTGRAIKRRDFQKEFVDKRKSAGDNNIFFIDGRTFFKNDFGEYAVDGCHPTDFGFYTMAKKLIPILKTYFD